MNKNSAEQSHFTLRILRNTGFKSIYKKLVLDQDLSDEEYRTLLTLAVIFIGSKNSNIKKLGYRIILMFSIKTGNYKPLYDISTKIGLLPISKTIMEMDKYEDIVQSSFHNLFQYSSLESFKDSNIFLTKAQFDLNNFFKENNDKTVSIIAPTSYGKSKLIISLIKENDTRNICIVVPTKALIAQTRNNIINSNINTNRKIVVHPEMYQQNDKNIIAIFTQERLLRMLISNKNFSFDVAVIDEAHNLLEKDKRNELLAMSIIFLKKRNRQLGFKFLTPFLQNSNNLITRYNSYSIQEFNVNEYLKSEKIFLFKNNKLKIYDQFLNEFYEIVSKPEYTSPKNLILGKAKDKNIIYFNRPKNIEKFSLNLASETNEVFSENINDAVKNLSSFFHKDYNLIDCIKKGIIYHHGSIPENVRLYIENLYSQEAQLKFVITNSTLLEGVNIPGKRLFIMENKKGRGNLTPPQLKNLMGRVCRLNTIFKKSSNNLSMLIPEIYILFSDFCRKDSNMEDFIIKSLKMDKKAKEEVSNILLEENKILDPEKDELCKAEEHIENIEQGTIKDYKGRRISTRVGDACFKNNIQEIDIISAELDIQQSIESIINADEHLDSAKKILEAILLIFIPHLNKIGEDRLSRLKREGARKFYATFLNWVIEGCHFSVMIKNFLSYWSKIDSEKPVFVGHRWGDFNKEEEYTWKKSWVWIQKKSQKERVNLAIVRIKEEQDFIENTLVKFIEVMKDMDIIETNFYNKIRYGTSDLRIITLIKSGYSNKLASLLINDYSSFVRINEEKLSVEIKREVLEKMNEDNVNEILIFEAKYNVRK